MASRAAILLRQNTRDRLLRVLLDACKERAQRTEILTTEHGPDMEWAVHERKAMLEEVNTIRRRHGKDPVDLDAIEKADRQATGHIDWSAKFAFYCAELALN